MLLLFFTRIFPYNNKYFLLFSDSLFLLPFCYRSLFAPFFSLLHLPSALFFINIHYTFSSFSALTDFSYSLYHVFFLILFSLSFLASPSLPLFLCYTTIFSYLSILSFLSFYHNFFSFFSNTLFLFHCKLRHHTLTCHCYFPLQWFHLSLPFFSLSPVFHLLLLPFLHRSLSISADIISQ